MPRTVTSAARRGAVLLALSSVGLGTGTAAADTARPTPTVTLSTARDARAEPSTDARLLAEVAATRPVTGARTVLPVLGTARDAVGRRWVRVLLPGRPNGRSGWIRVRGTRATSTPWSIEVDRSKRRGIVTRLGRVVRRFDAVVGAPATPTPVGRYFVEETVRLVAGTVGGPFALALSARSSVLQEFAGGPGQIALHGRAGLRGALGAAVSHGCLRLGDDDIRWLAARIGPGVRVTIRARGASHRPGTPATAAGPSDASS